MDLEQRAIDTIQARFPSEVIGVGEHAGQRWIDVRRDRIVDLLRLARTELGFDLLTDLTAVDWLNKGMPERFSIVYELYSMTENGHFRIKAWVPEGDEVIDTASGVWKAANWAEREVYDMFGITFTGHPDLRRILLPFTYPGHPLRKEYPLTGHGERFQFPKIER